MLTAGQAALELGLFTLCAAGMHVRPRAPGKLPATHGSWQAEGKQGAATKPIGTRRETFVTLCDRLVVLCVY
jgi:hypothetical protein